MNSNRRRMLHAFKADVGEYEDGGVLVLAHLGLEGVQHPAAVHDAASFRVRCAAATACV